MITAREGIFLFHALNIMYMKQINIKNFQLFRPRVLACNRERFISQVILKLIKCFFQDLDVSRGIGTNVNTERCFPIT